MSDRRPDGIKAVLRGNLRLASLLTESIEAGLREEWVSLAGGSVGAVFRRVLGAATRDLETDEEGERFLRLVCDGPLDPDEPYQDFTAKTGRLSDSEASTVVEFIRSRMITLFKGDLAELLAIKPAVALVRERFGSAIQAGSLRLFWGDTIRQAPLSDERSRHHRKGADGLLLDIGQRSDELRLRAVFEVKSIGRSKTKLEEQLSRHVERLRRGVTLEERGGSTLRHESVIADDPLLVVVGPSSRKLSRRYMWRTEADGRRFLVAEAPEEEYPEAKTPRDDGGLTRIQLRVSEEELDEAGFGMTYWYMGVAAEKALGTAPARPRDLTMSPSEDGQNRVKHMLHLLGLRPLTDRLRSLTAKLYNVHSYGYSLGIDSRVILRPDDFNLPEDETIGFAPKARDWAGPRTFEFDMAKGWGEWRVEREDARGWWVCSIALKDLAPNWDYKVGFHAGLGKAVATAARVSGASAVGDWLQLERQPARTKDDPPSPFPADPMIYRQPIGVTGARTDRRGRLELAFRFEGTTNPWNAGVVRRLVAAFVPTDCAASQQ